MKRIAELMHIAPATREEFLRRELNPDQETLRALWECGVRNQQYFGMGNLLIKSFEYDGASFREDMGRMADYLAARGQLIEKRRKDISREEQDHVSWWAPMKKLGQFLEEAPAGEAFYVLSSHFHADHFNPEVLTWRSLHPDIHYILSADIAKHRRAPRSAATFLHKGESYSDARLTVKAFGSTDEGVSFLLTLDGVTLYHAGDLNNWHWQDESTPEEVRKAEGDYLAELRNIQREVEAVDVAFFPVDNRMGSDYMRGARQFVEAIRVGLFVPMHYDEEVAAAAAFRPIAQANGAGAWMRPLPAPHKGG